MIPKGEKMQSIRSTSRHVNIGDTRLHIVERGSGYPVILLHGGPGLDHHMFGDYLDPLADEFRLILVDQRAQGLSDICPEETWSLQQMATDVTSLAKAMGLDQYAILGHSYGAFVALQNAVDYPGRASQTIVSSGLPSAKYLESVWKNLEMFEPLELREQVTKSWEREKVVETREEVDRLLQDQLPFQFGDPLDPRIAEFERRTAGGVNSPAVLRFFANAEYGGIEADDKLGIVTQPVLVLAGRIDRTCVVEGAEAMTKGLPDAELTIFENSGHMTYVEENEKYIKVVRDFLNKHR
jgi:proline iminopeptidase